MERKALNPPHEVLEIVETSRIVFRVRLAWRCGACGFAALYHEKASIPRAVVSLLHDGGQCGRQKRARMDAGGSRRQWELGGIVGAARGSGRLRA